MGTVFDDYVEVYWETYSDITLSEDILASGYSTEDYPYLCVGAYQSSVSSTATLMACGERGIADAATYSTSTAYFNNGAYWYRYAGYSFGFADSSAISLNSADTMSGAARLSWHLDGISGGYRAGDTLGLNGDTSWYKRVIVGTNGILHLSRPICVLLSHDLLVW